MVRKSALAAAVLAGAALTLAGCGDGGSKNAAAGSNPAMPPEDPARAAKVNGYDAAGKPIDAVTAAEMPESQLPPLTGDGAGPPPEAEPAPPAKAPPAG
ncbi:MAG TPA: hypothetical protein VEA15_12105 [Caulobacteraceae bacterium]|nr:hypothetical protein [Caulobacteraceae bacterium]